MLHKSESRAEGKVSSYIVKVVPVGNLNGHRNSEEDTTMRSFNMSQHRNPIRMLISMKATKMMTFVGEMGCVLLVVQTLFGEHICD